MRKSHIIANLFIILFCLYVLIVELIVFAAKGLAGYAVNLFYFQENIG